MNFPTKLEGKRVDLLAMEHRHADALFACSMDERIWTYLPQKTSSAAEMAKFIEQSLAAKEMGTEFPYVVYDHELKQLVGSTRLLNISVPNRNLEIGWTWYSPEVWRTRVNTECKYMLLQFAFEQFEAIRVQLKADQRNARSNAAIRRLGAVHEGVLRHDRIMHDGYIRNADLYSILSSEWPDVKERLELFLIQ
ncbi:GNAT family protein [Paenibacillus sp. HB172176]|uniref:GNAT family N-acetyltransferase n=1 Tax=Paenibacillus sp. HB172176 TaxID=2493690 RepID=UPI001438D053|nr:GNAT family protein [Paenibacillus sp. HB172176]